MSRRWPEAIRRRKEGEALRLYALLAVEHERVRRLGRGAARCRPAPQAWRPLHDVAVFQATGSRPAPLRRFCARFPDAALVPQWVPREAYLAALRVAVELAADGVVQQGGEPVWGVGQPRAPESAEAFEALCRRLRDRDTDAAELGSLAGILDAASLPEPPGKPVRVVFRADDYTLTIGDTAISVPEGQERDFLRELVVSGKLGRVTPVEDHGRVWKGAVDSLRRRIRRATGRPLLAEVVITAKGPVGGYRLNPNVEVRGASEPGLRFVPGEALDALAHLSSGGGRRPRGRPEDDD